MQIFGAKHTIYNYGQHDSAEFIRILLNDISLENNINLNPIPYI